MPRLPSDKVCKNLGGDFDFDSNTCNIPVARKPRPSSIFEKNAALFFVLQVGIGCATTVLSTYFGVTLLPTPFWVVYMLFGIVFAIATAMTWFKHGNWKEAIARAAISAISILCISLIIGTIYYWDAFRYLDVVAFSGEPMASVVISMPITALLSIILVDPSKRMDNDVSNDFTGNVFVTS